MKKKLTINEQIEYMKNDKGISFENYPEDKIEEFLENSTYFFKIKSFAKLFDKDNRSGKYWKLRFEQIVELSKLDLYLRRIMFKMCLSIEHQLKLNLLNDIAKNEFCNGYDIVKEFFYYNPKIYESIESDIQINEKETYSSAIAKKYFPDIPIWAIIEILNFSNFMKLYILYYKNEANRKNIKYDNKIENYSWSIRIIRNACAHNNCIINSLKNKNNEPNKQLITDINKAKIKLSSNEKDLLLKCLVNDVSIIVVLYNQIITSKQVKDKCMSELKNLFNDRFLREKNMFDYERKDNKLIIDSFRLVNKIINNLLIHLKCNHL